jgi:phosphatidylglycerophosphatase C
LIGECVTRRRGRVDDGGGTSIHVDRERPRDESREYAVFDFDRTIMQIDTGARFVTQTLLRSPVRLALALAATPLAATLAMNRRTLRWGVSVYVWISTFGTSAEQLIARLESFAQQLDDVVFCEALAALRRHRAAGHRIAVMSGSPAWLVAAVLQRVDGGEFTIVASTWRRFSGGFIAEPHCVREQKLRMARSAGLPRGLWHSGYTDSTWDIPMLRNCRIRTLVNPSPRTLARFRRAFGNGFEVVRWTTSR